MHYLKTNRLDLYDLLLSLLLLFIFVNNQRSFGQEKPLDKKISIRFYKATVPEALKQLGLKTGYFFNYSNSDVDINKIISKKYKTERLETIIKDIWGKAAIQIKFSGRTIDIQSTKLKTIKNNATIKGRIIDNFGNPVAGAHIILNIEGKNRVSNENGHFIIKNLKKDVYQITVSSIGLKTYKKIIEVQENISLEITLLEETENLDDITVYGKTKAKKQQEKAITVNSLDFKKFQNQSLGTEEILKSTAGLVIRQSGGLGSRVNINLNGLTGNAIPIYYDGIPLEILGDGIKLNTIPVDALERVDIYKGVVPIDIGTDALGGAVNLVPLKQSREYLRTSYSIGSFNTHRVSFTGLKKINKKIALSTISYFNYSENDYRMRNIPSLINIELPDGSLGEAEERINAKRFHNKHTSGFIEAKLHVKNLKWADRLVFASSYSKREDEIQHGQFIRSVAIGEVDVKTNAFSNRIDYRKKILNNKLNIRYYGVLSHTYDKVNDSTVNIYNWRGERLNQINESGSEFFRKPSLRRRKQLGTVHRFTIDYKLTDYLALKVSDFYGYLKVQGKDPVAELSLINNELIDLNSIPSTIHRNIFGAGLDALFFEDKLNVITFFKNYDYKAESIDVFQLGATVVPVRKIKNNVNGYGFALKYQIKPNIFIRTSFEKTTRIPSEREIFGNLAAVLPNFEIEPENSLNWNLGGQFEKRFQNDRLFLLNINGFIRDRENLIRAKQVSADNVRFINENFVNGKGFELEIKIIPFKNLSIKANYTAQSNEIDTKDYSSSLEVPNIPLSFYNVRASYQIENVFKSENELQFFWTYVFTDRFSINEVSNLDTAEKQFIIPEQKVHNAGLTYTLKKKKLAFSFNLQNITNTEVFDNFRIPRPGINYSFKINYSL